jgi:hypothetical protein
MICQPVNPLPLTTGRVGLSQTTGEIQFYGHNWRGVGAGVFTAQTKCWWPPMPWPRPGWGSCSCGGCGCAKCSHGLGSCGCFVYLLTHLAPWCCYWQDQQWAAWMTGKQPWPTTNTAAYAAMQSILPAQCLPVVPAPQAAAA